ncbi:type II toxin-antitoxin system death-on-curing family toxin [Bifidobacterium angulatum]|uniref:type II toxin-antitoxin system death-on-curing family toxin n=1 Tax=Bifidobacterium angulatum TaxID=1683 RepID=UPI0032197A8F
MPEQYTNEWWHIQAPPLVFQSDDLAEAMAQAIVQVHRRQLKDTGGFTVERADDIGSVSSVVDSTFLPVFGQSPEGRFDDLFRQVAHLTFHLAKNHYFADGNKRTAMAISLAILKMERIDLDIDDDPEPERNTLYKLISRLVTEEITEEQFAASLRRSGRLIDE